MTVIKIENLSKSFESNVVLDDISINVEEGENLIVFGRSGSGKSVLLKCIIGLLEYEAGEVFIKDKRISSLSIKELNKVRISTSFLFQGSALYDSMTVRENLEFNLLRHKEMPRKEVDKKVIDTLELVSLTEAVNKMPSELSGGMKKRVGLARSIITDPEIMFYDEPTTGLDPITAKEISELILNLQNQLNMTSIVVTHDLICAKIIANRVIFLREGKIAYEGDIESLTSSKDPFLINFFSSDFLKDNGELNV